MRTFKTAMLATVFGTMLISAASAAPVLIRDGNGGDLFNGGAGSRNIEVEYRDDDFDTHAGQFALQLSMDNGANWVNFLAYCLEIDEGIGINGITPVTGTLVQLPDSEIYTGNVATGIARVFSNVNTNSIDTANEAAGAQVAFWEVTVDGNAGGGSQRGLDRGNFEYDRDDSRSVWDNAFSFLQGNASERNNIWLIERAGFQDLVLVGFTPPTVFNEPTPPPNQPPQISNDPVPTPVMEPGTLGLLGMGLAGLIAVGRRKRS